MKNKSRRKFLSSAGAATAGLLATRSLPAWARKVVADPSVPLPLFRYSDVELLDGLFHDQFRQNHIPESRRRCPAQTIPPTRRLARTRAGHGRLVRQCHRLQRER
jgi:hypothetical protein